MFDFPWLGVHVLCDPELGFPRNFVVIKVSISPTFYERLFVWKFCVKLFCIYMLGLSFFWRKNIGKKNSQNIGEIDHRSRILLFAKRQVHYSLICRKNEEEKTFGEYFAQAPKVSVCFKIQMFLYFPTFLLQCVSPI